MKKNLYIISPHPDDAVWSLGGLISHWSYYHNVHIITVFDGDFDKHVIKLIHNKPENQWRQFVNPTLRRNEDAKAISSLGSQYISLRFIDAALRLSGELFEFDSISELFSPPTEIPSLTLINTISTALKSYIHSSDYIVAPLSIGSHVDHRIVTEAVKTLSNPIFWYPEFPYLIETPADIILEHINSLNLNLIKRTIPCSWSVWLQAASLYRSQVLRIFSKQQFFQQQLAIFAYQGEKQANCSIWYNRSLNFLTDPFADNKLGNANEAGQLFFR